MLRNIWKGPERRRHRRIEAAVELAVAVEMYGFEDDAPFFATGQTLDVSRGGVCASIDLPVGVGSVCKVFFRGADAHIEPAHVQGKILRCTEADDGFRIAIAFDEPLARLEVEESSSTVEKTGS